MASESSDGVVLNIEGVERNQVIAEENDAEMVEDYWFKFNIQSLADYYSSNTWGAHHHRTRSRVLICF